MPIDMTNIPQPLTPPTTGVPAPTGQQPTTQDQQTQQPFQFPSQWDLASNILSHFGTGGATATPGLWTQGGDIATQMAQTGMPVSTMPYYQAMKGVVGGDISDAIKQATEQAGLSGMRYSTPLGQQVSNIAGRQMGQFGAQALGMEMGAMEQARARQMQGIGQMYQYGAGQAGLTEAAKGRAMQSAGMLGNLGGMYAHLPGDIAQQAQTMGLQQQQAQQMAYMPMLQDFYRTMPEANPYMNQAMQMGQMQYPYAYPQYQPSTMSQFGNIASSFLPFLGRGGGGGGSTPTRQNPQQPGTISPW